MNLISFILNQHKYLTISIVKYQRTIRQHKHQSDTHGD